MDPLATYWNALAVRRNAQLPYWWVVEEHPAPRQDGGPAVGQPAWITPPPGQEGSALWVDERLRNGVGPGDTEKEGT